MAVGLASTHDIRLESSDDASPTTTVELMFAVDEETKAPRWTEGRLPPFPPRRQQGPLSYAHYDPSHDLVWSQKSWDEGGLTTLFEPDGSTDKKYYDSDGVDLRWKGVAVMGMAKSPQIGTGVPNVGFETGAASGWTLTAGTTGGAASVVAASSTNAIRTGTYALRLARGTGTASTAVYTFPWSDNWRSRAINLIIHGRRAPTNTGTGTLEVTINDGVATTTTSIAASTDSYTYLAHTKTLDALATQLVITIQNGAGNDTAWNIDDVKFVVNSGDKCVGMAEAAGKLYAAIGPMIVRWNETNDHWEVMFIHASNVAATDIVSYGDTIFVAFGYSNSYVFGTDTTWTTSALVAPADKAGYWAIRRNQLWKSESATTVKSSTNAQNAGSWSAAYTVGNASSDITKLYSFEDSIVVGKEDGLHIYLSVYQDGANADLFANVTNQFTTMVSADNFARGAEWMGRLFLTASQQSLMYYDGNRIVNLQSALQPPRQPIGGSGTATVAHTGWIRAMVGDPTQLYLLVDSNTADTDSSKFVFLYSVREVAGKWFVHPLSQVDIGIIDNLAVGGGYLWAFGRLRNSNLANDVVSIWRWTLPTKSAAPAFDQTPAIGTSGVFRTVVWDGGLPDEQKSLIALTIWHKNNLDANHTIQARFGVNGAGTATSIGIWNSAGTVTTKFFDTITAPETNAIGRIVQLSFTIITNDNTSPEMFAFALHAGLRPTRVRTWEIVAKIGDGVIQHNGLPDPTSKKVKTDNLKTLEAQAYPIRMTADFDQDGNNEESQIACHIVPGTVVRLAEEERQEGVELWRMLIQEVTVS